MKEMIFALLIVGIMRGMNDVGIRFFETSSRKIISLEAYKRRHAIGVA